MRQVKLRLTENFEINNTQKGMFFGSPIAHKDNVKNSDNLCIICFFNTTNSIINDGRIGHIITC